MTPRLTHCPVGEDWPQHRAEAEIAVRTIAEMSKDVASLEAKASHLEQLPSIAGSLKGLHNTMRLLILILGITLLILVIGRQSVKIPWLGLEIDGRHQKETGQ